ncbi:MAG: hypothetical protein SFZ03_01685 [Candidatus Melainabacteria bacterium]|nr:hypothetical protein [Candidatus Melainabacteria bacterium]
MNRNAMTEFQSSSLISQYMSQPAAASRIQAGLGQKWLFVGVDLAPTEMLESGITVLDRHRRLVRMDKLYSNDSIVTLLQSLAPAQNLIIGLDMPKNLGVPGKFRQEEIKLHPLRLSRPQDRVETDRFAARSRQLYDTLQRSGLLCFLYFSYLSKLHYDLLIPYRTRTPQGCRALQNAIGEKLKLVDMPANLAASSVLDSMICAYTAWLLYSGETDTHYELYADSAERLIVKPLKRWESTQPHRRKRLKRRYR